MIIRDAGDDGLPRIERFFPVIVAAGETYAYREDLDDQGIADLWFERPPDRCGVAVDGRSIVLGSAKMGPNRPGRGSHIATASFMVDPAAQGQGSLVRQARMRSTGRASRDFRGCSSMRLSRPTSRLSISCNRSRSRS